MDKPSVIAASQEPTVDDLIQALSMTAEETDLIQIKTIGQRQSFMDGCKEMVHYHY